MNTLFKTIQFYFRINAIEAELKQTNSLNGQMKKDVKELQQVIFVSHMISC